VDLERAIRVVGDLERDTEERVQQRLLHQTARTPGLQARHDVLVGARRLRRRPGPDCEPRAVGDDALEGDASRGGRFQLLPECLEEGLVGEALGK